MLTVPPLLSAVTVEKETQNKIGVGISLICTHLLSRCVRWSYCVFLCRRRRSSFLLGGHGGLAAGVTEVAHALCVLPPEVHEGLQVLQVVLRVQPHPVLLPVPEVRRGLHAHGAFAPLQGGRAFRSLLPHQQHGGAADQPDGAGAVVLLLRLGPQIPALVPVVVGTEHIVDLAEHSSKRRLPAERRAASEIADPSRDRRAR